MVIGEEDDVCRAMHLPFPPLASKKRPTIVPQEWDAQEEEENDIADFEVKRPNSLQGINKPSARPTTAMTSNGSSVVERPPGSNVAYIGTKIAEKRKDLDRSNVPSKLSDNREPTTSDRSNSKSSPTLLEALAIKSSNPPSKLQVIINAVMSMGTENEHLRGQLESYVNNISF